MKNSNIEWTDHTFNPWIGCTKVSPGCDNCYAEARMDKRLHVVQWGAGQQRKRTKTWGDPVRWNKEPFCECMSCGWRGPNSATVTIDNPAGYHPPVSWARGCPACREPTIKSARARVFCASLADVFDNEVPDEWRADLFDLILKTPNLDWLLLTKRIGNVGNMLPVPFDFGKLYPNVRIGISITSQPEADRDITKLLDLGLPNFLSMEPLLGPVDLTHLPMPGRDRMIGLPKGVHINALKGFYDMNAGGQTQIDWVIVGGESGPNARPMHPDWARSLRDQSQAAGVPFLFKQWGQFAPICWFDGPDADADNGEDFFDVERTDHVFLASDGRTWDTNGGQWMYPPMPLGHWCLMGSVGKKAAGRLLDGRTWDEVPA